MNQDDRFRLEDSPLEIARDIATSSGISSVSAILRIICDMTGMGFGAVARVTDGTWTACAVQDTINFGLQVGGQLPVHTTLCIEARAARKPVVFNHASTDPQYRDHHTPRLYNIESYISVPIVLPDGEYFGNLCAIDPKPRNVSDPSTVEVFERFAALIAIQLESERRRTLVERQLFDAQAANELREHFIAVLGHDLRNPISSMAMTGEILVRSGPDPKTIELGQRIRSTTKRMGALIDDVLDLARGRLGPGIGLMVEAHGLMNQLLADVVEEMRLAHPSRQIHAQIDIDRLVLCDGGRVQQVLSNLLANALAYGAPDQSVMVTADVVGEFMEIAVLNEGEPISEDVQRKLFEPYWRAPTSLPGGGLGLGLYICAQIAKEHLGSIAVTSSKEGGTMFLVRLPVGRLPLSV
ncbi:MAG: histidine kinase [Rhodoferax sp.]|nr:histidine kinase [Rhodoferax sp.]